ncbi:uncharacterized protein EI90DRAFT_2088239 [Cantharellus anzutake]|uniref:uncharacterized protein n=1 Tax=Cantharellus anzutake TaxID=1750568 RepID=UPI0019064853|nr:uncharacterized protein EI90DRAFT_2088239 [Cantharellus anzutake]KAF8340613.1 hypothetical protein EI90DRAFT_2088239 [Cantharellus anzutake]
MIRHRVFDIVRLVGERANGPAILEGHPTGRLGIWGHCVSETAFGSYCVYTGLGYPFGIGTFTLFGDDPEPQIITPSYTRGLVMHPIALAFCIITLGLSFWKHLAISLAASLLSNFTAILTAIALILDIRLYTRVRSRANNLTNVQNDTYLGPAFWMTLTQILFLVIAGFAIYLARHRDRAEQDRPNIGHPTMVQDKA